MALQYPTAGAIYYTQISAATQEGLIDGIKDALVACGWTAAGLTPQAILTLDTYQPNNGNTVTIAGQEYTFRSSINNSNANEVLIDSTIGATMSNLKEAICEGTGKGTKYSTPTTANASCTATVNAAVVTVLSLSGSNFTISESTSNLTVDTTPSSYGYGWKVLMPATPQGLCGGVILDIALSVTAYIRIRCTSADFTTVLSAATSSNVPTNNGTGSFWLTVAGGRVLEFCGCAHQFLTWLLNDTSTGGTKFCMSVPYVRPAMSPSIITAASNANPIQITTSGEHGLTNGQDVFIADVVGNTAANGFWTITYIDAHNFSLNSSNGNGTWTSGGLAAGPGQIGRAIVALGDSYTTQGGWRISIGGTSTNWWVATNQLSYAGTSSGSGQAPGFALLRNLYGTSSSAPVYNWGVIADLIEPRICYAPASQSGTPYIMGQLWAAFVIQESQPMDRIQTGFDSHDWINFCHSDTNQNASLWIAKS